MSHQSPAHQVRQEVTEGGPCGRAEADRQKGHGEGEEKARDDGEKYGAGYGECLEEQVDTQETSQYLQKISCKKGESLLVLSKNFELLLNRFHK